jgi:hypothetical protein
MVTDLESSATVKSDDLQSFVADADLSLSYSAWIQFVRVQQRVMVLLNVLAEFGTFITLLYPLGDSFSSPRSARSQNNMRYPKM